MDPENFFPQAFDDDDFGSELIEFVFEETDFSLDDNAHLRNWIERVVREEGKTLNHLCFIFCNDAYLHKINLEYLDHDTLTDIITFPYDEPPFVEGDIFISVDRVRENAEALGLPFLQELHRVVIHGVLHLCGYGDGSADEKKAMRAKEDEKLGLLGLW